MPISPALYKASIPVARLQGARLYENVNKELIVEVQIANEVQGESEDDGLVLTEALNFGNFVYLSTDQQKILNLVTHEGELKKLILGSQTDPSYLHNYRLSLTQDDFQFTQGHLTNDSSPAGDPIEGAPIYSHSTYKTFVLNRTAGGNIMTGLIADAHIHKVFGGSQQIVGLVPAWAAAARGETVIPLGGNQWKIPSDLDVSAGRLVGTPERVENLYILIVSYRTYMPEKSSADSTRARPERCFLGNLTKEILLINSKSPLKSKLWKTAQGTTGQDPGPQYGTNGSVWPGDVHVTIDNDLATPLARVMAGTHHSSQVHSDLESSQVPNIKIKDLRFLNVARRLSFEYNSPTNIKRPYFSPLTLSRDPYGFIHGAFGFDLQKYAQDHSVYGPLIKNTTSLLSCVGLSDIIIYRRVIKRSSGGNKLTQRPNFNAESPISSGWEPVKFIGPDDAPDQRVWRLLDLPRANEQGITNIIFLDKEAKNYTKGTLEYKAEITITDVTKDALKLVRDDLLIRTAMATRREHGLLPPGQLPPSFDPIITDYLTAVNFIFGSTPFARYSLGVWKKNLQALAAPINPVESDRILVIDLIRDFIAQLSQQLTTIQANAGGTFQVYSSIASPSPPGVHKAEHHFRNRYKVSYPKLVGMGYLPHLGTTGYSVLPSVSFEEFQVRINQELAKYALTNTGVAGLNPYGYLSCHHIYFGPPYGEDARGTGNFNLNPSSYTALFRNNVLDTYHWSPTTEDTSTSMAEIFAAAGAAVVPLQESLREVLFPETDPVAPPVSPDLYMGSLSLFNFGENTAESSLSGSTQSIQVSVVFPIQTIQYSPAAAWLLNYQLANWSLPTVVNNPSNIPNSLALAKYNEDNAVIENSNTLSNMINFEELVRVEYLESYDTYLGAAKPIWKILDIAAFENALAGTESLLCRLVSLSGVIDVDVDLGLPPLSTLFILGTPVTSGPTVTFKTVLEEIEEYIRTLNSSILGGQHSPSEIYYSQNVLLPPATSVGS